MGNAVSALGAFLVGASLAFPFLYGCLQQRYWLAFGAAWVTMMGVAMAGGAAAEAAAKPHPGALFWSLFGGASLAVAVGVIRLVFGEWPSADRLAAPETAGVLWAIQAGTAVWLLAYPIVPFIVAMSFDAWSPALEATPGGRLQLAVAQAALWYPVVFLLCYGVGWLAWWGDWRWAAVAASATPFLLTSLGFAAVVYLVTSPPSPPPVNE